MSYRFSGSSHDTKVRIITFENSCKEDILALFFSAEGIVVVLYLSLHTDLHRPFSLTETSSHKLGNGMFS